MKVYQKILKKNITINEKNDFLASGGEGTIYLKDGLCYKVTDHPFVESKLNELMLLKRNNIVVPVDFISDHINNLIGYVLPYVDGDPLCKLFNTQFWSDNNFDSNNVSQLLDKCVESIQYIHDNDCLVVDWNEMNFMVDKNYSQPYFIDTNAWKTKSFPPDAITPLFQDHLSNDFSRLTDWYGYAILACKLYLGIHPFKGTHPNYGRTQTDTLKRMKDCVSIFNKNAKVPAATRDFSNIPDSYSKWFIDLFENGKRELPPNVVGYVTVAKQKIESKFKFFKTDLVKTVDKDIERYYHINGADVVFCKDEIQIDLRKYPIQKKMKIGVIVSQREKKPFFMYVQNNMLCIIDEDGKNLDINFACEDFLVQDHVIYAKNRDQITEIICQDLGYKQVFSIDKSWSVMPNSTKAMGNCFYSSVMGNVHFLIPWILNGKYYLRNIRVKDLDGYKIVEAKFDKNVLMIIGERGGKYDRFRLIIDNINDDYLLHLNLDISVPVINFVVLDSGVGVSMDEDGIVEIFTANTKKFQSKSIQDDSIQITLRLFKRDTMVLFADGKKLYSLKTS